MDAYELEAQAQARQRAHAANWRRIWFHLAGGLMAIDEMWHERYPDPDTPGTLQELAEMRDLAASLSALTVDYVPDMAHG